MTDRELMQQALEALDAYSWEQVQAATTALRERLAQPEQEPVAWADMDVRGEDKGLSWTPGHFHKTPLYTTPPQRKPLTDEECDNLWAAQLFDITDRFSARDFIRDVEAAHGIKGEA